MQDIPLIDSLLSPRSAHLSWCINPPNTNFVSVPSNNSLTLPYHCPSCPLQHAHVVADHHGDILYQLVQRTMDAVHMLDHQNYRRLQKILMRESEKNDTAVEESEIESEPPRWVGHVALLSLSHQGGWGM